MKKLNKIIICVIFIFIFSATIGLVKGFEPGEDYDPIEKHQLFLIEVENIDDYAKNEEFVDVVIGFDHQIGIQRDEEVIKDFDEVVSLCFDDSDSLDERWKTISNKNYLPVAEIHYVYKYYKGISVSIPKSWIQSLSNALVCQTSRKQCCI